MEKERRVIIIGAGGVGFWLAVGLCRIGIDGVEIFDPDDLQGGLGHGRLPLATPTTRKVDLLKGFLRVNFGGTVPVVHAEPFTGNEAGDGDLVVDCTDLSGKARATMWRRAEKRGARLLRVSYDGANSIVTVAEGLPLTANQKASGYANVPSLGLSLAAGGIGAEVVTRLLANWEVPYVDFQVAIGDWVPAAAAKETAAA